MRRKTLRLIATVDEQLELVQKQLQEITHMADELLRLSAGGNPDA